MEPMDVTLTYLLIDMCSSALECDALDGLLAPYTEIAGKPALDGDAWDALLEVFPTMPPRFGKELLRRHLQRLFRKRIGVLEVLEP